MRQNIDGYKYADFPNLTPNSETEKRTAFVSKGVLLSPVPVCMGLTGGGVHFPVKSCDCRYNLV